MIAYSVTYLNVGGSPAQGVDEGQSNKKMKFDDAQPSTSTATTESVKTSTESAGEQLPTLSSKSKHIVCRNGIVHVVLDVKDHAERRDQAEFMNRMLDPARHEEFGLGPGNYRPDPGRLHKQLIEVCSRVGGPLTADEACWESAGHIIYLSQCPAIADSTIFKHACFGELEWDKVYQLSIMSFHRTGATVRVPKDITTSTVEFRVFLAECFKGLELWLQAVCHPVYEGLFRTIVHNLEGPQNIYKSVSNAFLFHTLNAWLFKVFKFIRTLDKPDKSLYGPEKCRAYILEHIATPCAELQRVVDGDASLERHFESMQLQHLKWTPPEPRTTRQSEKDKIKEPVVPGNNSLSRDYFKVCFHDIAQQLGLAHRNNKNKVECKMGTRCARTHVPLAQLDFGEAISVLPRINGVGKPLREDIIDALKKEAAKK
jgi:hypothetical protein